MIYILLQIYKWVYIYNAVWNTNVYIVTYLENMLTFKFFPLSMENMACIKDLVLLVY